MADKALLMGINKYKNVTPLRGCENDVRNMRDLLIKTLEFPEKNVRVLLTPDVVKSAVLPQMDWLFEGASPGDRVVLHFSGHGSYTIDLDGDEDEARDELICLYDMDVDFVNKNGYMLDDELRAWTKKKPNGVELVVILDNCHSGTGTRLLAAPSSTRSLNSSTGEVRIIERATRERNSDRSQTRNFQALAEDSPQNLVLARFVEPPEEIQRRAARAPAKRSLGMSTMNHVLLAGCSSAQTAADAFIDNKYQGAFSHYLGKILRGGGAGIDRGELLTQLRAALKDNNYDQTPQLEGPLLTGPLFGGGDVAPGRNETESPVGDMNADLLREILSTLKAVSRKLDAQAAPGSKFARAAAGAKALVYVHGIGVTAPGYSEDWWNSLEPHVPSLSPGTPDAIRFEVFWGDIVNRSLKAESREAKQEVDDLREELEAMLRDRRAATAPSSTAEEARGVQARALTDDIQNFLGLPQIDDFLRYLTFESVRRECIARFTSEVEPLLREGRNVEIISHSWGTVVAYEGLRELEAKNLPGRVHNFFTAGAALSTSLVTRRLRPANRDKTKPAMVQTWTNLDAQGDLVGGSLRANGFDVDNDFVNLTPTGCRKGFFGYGLVCAHSSYFVADNSEVNEEIFGELIEQS